MEERIDELVKVEVSSLEQWAGSLVIATAEDYRNTHQGIMKVKEVRKKWTDYWKPLKEKAHSTWKEITTKEKEGTDKIDKIIAVAETKALQWKQEQDRKAEAERRRLQAEVEEKARRERERLRKEAEKLKTPELKQERIEQAEAVQIPVISVQSVEKVEGVATRKIWVAELVDMEKLVASAKSGTVAFSLLSFDSVKANNFARATKGTIQVEGIRFVEKETFTHKTNKGGE